MKYRDSLHTANEKFHSSFPDVPLQEVAVEWKSCKLNKTKGKLFITAVRLAFCSESEKHVVLLDSVVQIQHKANFFLSDVLLVDTGTESFTFTDFSQRQMDYFVLLLNTFFAVRKAKDRATDANSPDSAEAFETASQYENDNEKSFFSLNDYEERLNKSDASLRNTDVNNHPVATKAQILNSINYPNFDPGEDVVGSHNCCLVSESCGQGSLCVTETSIIFVSPSMGPVARILLENVVSLEKEQFFIIISGITITSKERKPLCFINLPSRDDTFKMIQESVTRAQNKARNGAMGNLSRVDLTKLPAGTRDDFSKVETDFGTAFSDYSCFTKSLITPIDFPRGKNIMDVFSVAFDDGTKILERYHVERNDKQQEVEDWRPTIGVERNDFSGQRVFKCVTPVKVFFGKLYPYTEYQRYAFFNINNCPTLMVQFTSQISGVLFSDTFRAEALIVCTQTGTGADAVVQMEAFGYIQFLRSCLAKNKIMHNTLDIEFPEGYKKIGTLIVNELTTTASVPQPTTIAEGEPQVESLDHPEEVLFRPVQSRTLRIVQGSATIGCCLLVIVCAINGLFRMSFLSIHPDKNPELFIIIGPILCFGYFTLVLTFLKILDMTWKNL